MDTAFITGGGAMVSLLLGSYGINLYDKGSITELALYIVMLLFVVGLALSVTTIVLVAT